MNGVLGIEEVRPVTCFLLYCVALMGVGNTAVCKEVGALQICTERAEERVTGSSTVAESMSVFRFYVFASVLPPRSWHNCSLGLFWSDEGGEAGGGGGGGGDGGGVEVRGGGGEDRKWGCRNLNDVCL